MAHKSKVAFVTGAASGIGRATAKLFIQNGYSTVLVDRDEANGKQAAEEFASNGECIYVACDVSDEESVKNAVEKAVGHFGRIDAAFNAAGIDGVRAPMAESTPEVWHKILAVNLTGVYFCMLHQTRQMLRQQGGTIVNCSSLAGLVGTVLMPAYVAAKHGVVGLTKNAALDYAQKNIRVNAVCPGMIDTPMWRKTISPELTAELLRDDPAGRLGLPEEIASTVLWLSSEASSFVNGQAIAVDGGRTSQ